MSQPILGSTLREQVAEEVRVLLARRRTSATALAKTLGVSQTYVWRRLTGETAFDLDDLERIANALGVTVLDLLPRSAGERDVTQRYDQSEEVEVSPKRADRRRPGGVSRPPNVPSPGRRPAILRRPISA